MSNATALDFEKRLATLEQEVRRLESGELSLEDALAAFGRGVQLTQDCQQALAAAEQKVQQLLISAQGEVELANFPVSSSPTE